MSRAYISARVKDELRIKSIRDKLWAIADAREYYKKVTPHITVIPPFTVKKGSEQNVEQLVEDSPLVGREVKVNRIGVYENIIEPYVVLLNVDVEIEDVRRDLLDELPEHTQGEIIEPVRPHITLFKTRGHWSEIDKDIRVRIQQEVIHMTTFQNTEVDKVEVDFKE
jgi:2'-5' RNA ligase